MEDACDLLKAATPAVRRPPKPGATEHSQISRNTIKRDGRGDLPRGESIQLVSMVSPLVDAQTQHPVNDLSRNTTC
jgi:hypothetical protein